jgi:hypothetical protein
MLYLLLLFTELVGWLVGWVGNTNWFIHYLVYRRQPFEMLVIFTTTISVINRYRAIKTYYSVWLIIYFSCYYSNVLLLSFHILQFPFCLHLLGFQLLLFLERKTTVSECANHSQGMSTRLYNQE